MEKEKKESFSYIYSAKEHKEIERIRSKYVAGERKEEDKLSRLRRLDEEVTKKAQAASLTFGILGTLLLGCGMSLTMTDIGNILGEYGRFSMPIGIAVGIVGILIICVAYPTYERIVSRERKKIAPEIIRLTDELLK